MNPQQAISLLEEVERKEHRAQRTAVLVAWSCVSAAAIVLVVILGLGYRHLSSIRRHVSKLTNERDGLQAMRVNLEKLTRELQTQRDNFQTENISLDKQSKALQRIVRQNEPSTSKLQSAKPAITNLPPRVYLQIVNQGYRTFAQEMSRKLADADCVVFGIEYVPNAIKPNNTEVQFYRHDDKEIAEKIVMILQEAGDSSAHSLFLAPPGAMRPKHYEIWFSQNLPQAQQHQPGSLSKSPIRDH